MPLQPSVLDQRLKLNMAQLWSRLRKVEARTAGIDSGFPLMALPGVIDAAYTTGDPKVYVNGATALSGPFQHLSSYTPVANDPVLLLPVPANRTYVVLGKLV